MVTLEVYVPTAQTRLQSRPLAPRLTTLSGIKIGWLDNMKANANQLLLEVARIFQARGHAFELLSEHKNATGPAPESVIAHLKCCDAVVLAIAD